MSDDEMQVRLIEDGPITHIEPKFDEKWDEEKKLRWFAAVTMLDTGLCVDVQKVVSEGISPCIDNDKFVLTVHGASHRFVLFVCPFTSAVAYLNGITAGITMQRSIDKAEK